MKKQVAQFVPYTDTLGVKKDTTGMSPVAVGDDGKLYTDDFISLWAEEPYGGTVYNQGGVPAREVKFYTDQNHRNEITAKEAYEIMSNNVGKKFHFGIYVGSLYNTEIDYIFNTIVTIAGNYNYLIGLLDIYAVTANGTVSIILENTGSTGVNTDPYCFAAYPVSVFIVCDQSEYIARGTYIGDS